MIRISQVKLPLEHKEEELLKKCAKLLKIPSDRIQELVIVKKSIDARKKGEIYTSYTVDLSVQDEDKVLNKVKMPNISLSQGRRYVFPDMGEEELSDPPVIVGTGPAGLFCGLMLAESGYRPILIERGEDVDARRQRVEEFWKTGNLSAESNVQFGEGGAGTFSDGKLNTLVKDVFLRNQKVLEVFVEAGADPSILYLNKPHIGTDVLQRVVKNIRNRILELGGQVLFQTRMTDLITEDNKIIGITVNGGKEIKTGNLVLAVGHSARDTFQMLEARGVRMDAKAFAVGLRIQHPQKLINRSQYGYEEHPLLAAADYKLTKQTSTGRGVYSFCMCPGGYVVDASSEEGRLAVNGMSYHSRDGINANSALIVTVTPEDFPVPGPLGGIEFQRNLEEAAFVEGRGRIPVQLYGDFVRGRKSKDFEDVQPALKGRYEFADLRKVLPDALSLPLIEAMGDFDRRIKGFGREDSILAGVESRTSSPVRIVRGEDFEASVKGLYPCGEGAGYAGGITSAAMDGIKVAEAIRKRYKKLS